MNMNYSGRETGERTAVLQKRTRSEGVLKLEGCDGKKFRRRNFAQFSVL